MDLSEFWEQLNEVHGYLFVVVNIVWLYVIHLSIRLSKLDRRLDQLDERLSNIHRKVADRLDRLETDLRQEIRGSPHAGKGITGHRG